MQNKVPDYETDERDALDNKDNSLRNMAIVLGVIILIMGYLTFFVDDPWKFLKSEKQRTETVKDKSDLLNQSEEMSNEELRKSLVKFIEAFYVDQQRGYFDQPSYFANITETFYNYHNLTHQRLKDIYWKRKEDMQNLRRNWVVSSLDFTRNDSRITATYWAKEIFFRPSTNEQQTVNVKYELVIDEDGKIVSLKELQSDILESYLFNADTLNNVPTIDLNEGATPASASSNQVFDYSVVEVVPEFIGGQKELAKFITANMNYPEKARENNIQGKVYAAFIVEKDGTIRDIKIRQGIGSGCDEEAIRLLKLSPKWKPGTIKGEPVTTYCTLPITFQLSN